MHQFVEKIIAFALKNHVLILFLTAILLVTGIFCFKKTPIEAYPDVTNTRVKIIAQWPGRSAEEVEKFVTLPVMQQLNTIPRKTDVRSTSLFGLAVVTVLFEDGVDDFYAQQYASNRMQDIDLPEGAELSIEPPSGATGEIFRYVLKSNLPVREVSAIHEWVVQRELLAVPGIATIASFGGEEKMFEIKVNPAELQNYDLSPLQVYEAVSRSNINVGGDMIQKSSQAYVVRGIGLLESVEDIENILIEVKGDAPIRVKQVAQVSVSSKPRLGQVGLNDNDDVVQGIVIMLRGQNPGEVIANLKVKIEELNEYILPPEVKIEPFMDREKLVDNTLNTVMKNMAEGILLVSIIVFLFLFNGRTTFIVASVIPLSFLFAVIMLRIQRLPANLISMGALDFGLLLEGTLVIVEAIYVAMEKRTLQIGERFTHSCKSGLIKKSASAVATHIFFAQIILVVALIPIFSFQKVEGKMFKPLAFTLTYALLGSLILSLTYVPALCKLLLKKPVRPKKNRIADFFISRVYRLYDFASRHRKAALISFVGLLAVCFLRFGFWGTEFIPSMNEGAIYIRATLPNSVNLDESVRLTKEMKQQLQAFEEIDFILTQTGRPNDGTDATGFFNIEFHVELKPEKEWKRRVSKDDIIGEMQAIFATYPGIVSAFSQPIQDNVEEYVAGVKSSLVIKIFGNDLYELETMAEQTANAISDVRGIEDVNIFRSIGLPELQIKLEESRMARYAVSMEDAQAVVEMAIGGKSATSFYENERTFDVVIRFQKEFRDDEEKIGNILIPTMNGKQVPLKEIADIRFITGPAFIYREGGSRYVSIGFSIRDRDLGSTIAEAQQKVNEQVQQNAKGKAQLVAKRHEQQNATGQMQQVAKGQALSKSTPKIVWAGEFESQQRASKQLILVIPIVLALILFLLYLHFGTVKDTLIAATSILFAFTGGFLSLWLTGTTFGISAGVGFIVLLGIAVINSILLISLMKQRMHQTRNLRIGINEAVSERIRPILMIALMGSFGLLPAALSTGMGSEVQKSFAIVIVGGVVICMLLSFTVLPQIFYFVYRRNKKLKNEEVT